MDDQRATQIEERTEWIARNRERYSMVMKTLSDKAEVRKLFTVTIPNAIQELMVYDPKKDQSDVAVAACSRAQLRFATLLDDVEFIETYEERREILENLEIQASRDADEGNAAEAGGEPSGDLP